MELAKQAIAIIKQWQNEGLTLDGAAQRYVRAFPLTALKVMDTIGNQPEPELAAIQKAWK